MTTDMDAVVVGAGVAGLAAAGVLAGRCRRVVLLDGDDLPEAAAPRRSVPQGGHAHALLVGGRDSLESIFPGLTAELIAEGAVSFDWGTGLAFHVVGAVWPAEPLGVELVTFTRPLLERVLRRRVAAQPRVEIRQRTTVVGLAGDATRVSGVLLDGGGRVEADLVVDCTGRGNRSDRWLSALGCPAVRSTEVRIDVGYATRFYRRLPGDLAAFPAVYVLPTPPDELRLGVMLPVEDDRWLITLGGWHHACPVDPAEFGQHAELLPHPAIATIMADREPVTDLALHRFPSSRRRYFEELNPPAGFVALGDAVSSFNPVYGQGMTCAAMEAVALGQLLDRRPAVTTELSAAFHREVAAVLATPTQLSINSDFAFRQTQGVRPRGVDMMNWYSRKVQRASHSDVRVRRAFAAVQHMVHPATVLQRPGMLWRVLRAPAPAATPTEIPTHSVERP